MIRLIFRVGPDEGSFRDQLVTNFRVFEIRNPELEACLHDKKVLVLTGVEIADDPPTPEPIVTSGSAPALPADLAQLVAMVERLQREGTPAGSQPPPLPPAAAAPALQTEAAPPAPPSVAITQASLKERLTAKFAWRRYKGVAGESGNDAAPPEVKPLPLP